MELTGMCERSERNGMKYRRAMVDSHKEEAGERRLGGRRYE